VYIFTFEFAGGFSLLHYYGKFSVNALAVFQHFAFRGFRELDVPLKVVSCVLSA